jgi:hypothetical protein
VVLFLAVSPIHCPHCEQMIVAGVLREPFDDEFPAVSDTFVLYPSTKKPRPVPAEVPAECAKYFRQASLILDDSPEASAALSRRVLQMVLHDHFQIKRRTLDEEIKELLGRNTIPSHLSEYLDAIRNVGNFAAHPIKDQNTSAIVEVEPGEAEWMLDLLDLLFDFCFVQPAKAQAAKAALNAKLKAAGKPQMK